MRRVSEQTIDYTLLENVSVNIENNFMPTEFLHLCHSRQNYHHSESWPYVQIFIQETYPQYNYIQTYN